MMFYRGFARYLYPTYNFLPSSVTWSRRYGRRFSQRWTLAASRAC